MKNELTGHTPAPWAWNEHGQLVAGTIKDEWDGDYERPNVIVETDSGFYGPHGLDRSLIAAAHPLRAALQAIVDCNVPLPHGLLQQARAALDAANAEP